MNCILFINDNNQSGILNIPISSLLLFSIFVEVGVFNLNQNRQNKMLINMKQIGRFRVQDSLLTCDEKDNMYRLENIFLLGIANKVTLTWSIPI